MPPLHYMAHMEAQRLVINMKRFAVKLALLASPWGYAHEVAPKDLGAGDPLVVDAANGLNLRPEPNSGKVGVIPDKSVIFATGAAELHATGRRGNKQRYWAPVKFQNENGEWIAGWVLVKHTSVAHNSPNGTAPAVQDKLVFDQADDTDGVEKAIKQEAAPAGEKPQAAADAVLTINVKSNARLRAGPGTRHGIITRLTNNSKVRIIGKPKGHWIPVRVDGSDQVGWIHMSLLNAEGAFNPYEVAQGHETSAEDARAKISEYAEDHTTEAGVSGTCDGSAACRNKGNQRIAIPEEDEDVTPSGKDFIKPVNVPIRSFFGKRTDPITGAKGASHGGLDFSVSPGTGVKASKGGRVVQVKTGCRVGNRACGGGWGNHVIIDHGNGIRTVYAHLSSVNVSEGQRVSQGTRIAKSGNTGRTSGPNVHLEVHKNGVKQDPRRYLGI